MGLNSRLEGSAVLGSLSMVVSPLCIPQCSRKSPALKRSYDPPDTFHLHCASATRTFSPHDSSSKNYENIIFVLQLRQNGLISEMHPRCLQPARY
ncbi:hypothetical protein BDR05DRAFT_333272 [Suillus weaverae]|nr:hypothetical protein BDR05DRAFT_333272 [Suillus weaverae]